MNKKKNTALIALAVCASLCAPSALQAQPNKPEVIVKLYMKAFEYCTGKAMDIRPFDYARVDQCMEHFIEYSYVMNASCSLYKKNFYKKKLAKPAATTVPAAGDLRGP